MLFTETINNWNDWGRVYRSIPAFEALSAEILRKEGLPLCELENMSPGTNAVFKAGDYVLKIFAPKESGMDQSLDRQTEIFTMKFAEEKGIATPSLVAEGHIEDKYDFAYIIMKYIKGQELQDKLAEASAEESFALGRELRKLTEALHAPCEKFNDKYLFGDEHIEKRWDKFPDTLLKERREYLHTHDFGEFGFVHGDLCIGNILVGDELYLIDFADAVLAPKSYEFIPILFDYREFGEFLKGYFEGDEIAALTETILEGLLLHAFGGAIAADAFGTEIRDIEELRGKINTLLTEILR